MPGEGDFAIGVDRALSIIDEHKLPALAANLRCGERAFEGSRLVERGGFKLGIIGVVGVEIAGCEASDALTAAKAAAAEVAGADLILALVHGSAGLERQIAAEVEGVDVVINGHTRPTHKAATAAAEGVWAVGSGSRGKKLGVLEMEKVAGATTWSSEDEAGELASRLDRYRGRLKDAQERLEKATDDDARERAERLVESYTEKVTGLEADLAAATAGGGAPRSKLRHSLVDLSTEVADHGPTQALVDKAKADITAAESAPGKAPAAPVRGPYAGWNDCGSCHLAEAEQWRTTPHATAFQTLAEVERQLDQDCFSCHVTGAFHEDGPQRPAEVPGDLQGVGCESCHGPAKEHAANPAKNKVASAAVDVSVCTQCHDGVQDEGRFDYATYLPKVLHTAAGP